ncbi:hypothetical protein ACLEPN_22820 [Myxococcus sp. 1LA]
MNDAETKDLAYRFYRLLEDPNRRDATLEKLRAASPQLKEELLDLATKNADEAEKEYQARAATLHSVLFITERRKELAEDAQVQEAAKFTERGFSMASKKLMIAQDVYMEVSKVYFEGLKLPK